MNICLADRNIYFMLSGQLLHLNKSVIININGNLSLDIHVAFSRSQPQSTNRQNACQATLLQKQAAIHAEHMSQTQYVLTRHQKERHDFNSIPMPSEKQREKSRQDMENRHQNELLELQDKQNKEKIEAMQEMLAGVSFAQSESHGGQEQLAQQDAATVPGQQEQIADSTTAPKRPKREKKDSSNSDSDPTSVPYTKRDSMDSNANESSVKSVDRATLDAQKSSEIKALMRDKSLDRDMRREKLDEIKNRYAKLSSEVSQPDTTTDSTHQRKVELQAIMKDRSLSKEERLKKLAEVKKKYPLEQGHRRATVDDAPRAKVGSNNKYKRVMPVPLEAAADRKKETKRASRSTDEKKNKRSSSHSEKRKLPAKDISEHSVNSRHSEESELHTKDIPAHTDDDEMQSRASSSINDTVSSASDMEKIANGSTARNLREEEVMSKDASNTQEDTVSSEEGDHVGELSESFKSRRRSSQDGSMYDDDEMDITFEPPKREHQKSGPPTNIANYVPKMNRKNSSESQSKSVTISEPSSTNTSSRSLKTDPLENADVNKTPIKTLIRKLEKNDPSITVLKLDGRGKIKEGDWETFFETLENNTTLTHLSLGRCGLTDDLVVGLILALVENVTITALHLKSNKDITESK